MMKQRRRNHVQDSRSRRAKTNHRQHSKTRNALPTSAYRGRGHSSAYGDEPFNAPETWHEPTNADHITVIEHSARAGFFHPVTAGEILERIAQLPTRWKQGLDVVQLSPMTRKRSLFPCYGMQWGSTVYLYPIEESLVETYIQPPQPQQLIEARMFGGVWTQEGNLWHLSWTESTIRDFYLNNVLIHEIGHINDDRNRNFDARERYANWFAIEYGYRASRGRR